MNNINKCVGIVLLNCVVLLSLGYASTLTQLTPFTPELPALSEVQAKSYIIVAPETRQMLAGKDIHRPLPPASLTKVMTAYMVFEAIKEQKLTLEQVVEVSDLARRQGGSRTYLEKGDLVSIEVLLKGLLVHSGNDSAVALAEAVSGSVDAFVEAMNHKSQQLGMRNTQWKNPNGLPTEGHVSSAYDLALLASQIINTYPEYYHYFGIKSFRYADILQRNRNRLLFSEEFGVDGMKTGWTVKAGYCVVTSMQRDNLRLVSVVLGAMTPQARFDDSKKLFEYAYEKFSLLPFLSEKNRVLKTIRVYGSAEQYAELVADHSPQILIDKAHVPLLHYEITAPDFELEAAESLAAHFPYGRIRFYADQVLLSDQPLYIMNALNALNYTALLKESWGRFLSKTNSND